MTVLVGGVSGSANLAGKPLANVAVITFSTVAVAYVVLKCKATGLGQKLEHGSVRS